MTTDREQAIARSALSAVRGRRMGACVAAIVAGVGLIVSFDFVRVSGESMAPTLTARDVVLIFRGPFLRNRMLRRAVLTPGRIALFRRPVDGSVSIKRVVALDGDTIALDRGQLLVNGRVQREGYVVHQSFDSWPWGNARGRAAPISIPPGHCFVLGDNRRTALDSRYWGAVPYDTVIGIAVWVVGGGAHQADGDAPSRSAAARLATEVR